MPRPAVPQEKRRRVARACDNCKRRKERCDGVHPCLICIRRSREFECRFSDVPARLLRPSQSHENVNVSVVNDVQANASPGGASNVRVSPPRNVTLSGPMSDTSQAEMAIDRILNSTNVDHRGVGQPQTTGSDPDATPESVAPVPRLARLLRDNNGKFMYVGDSASLSFLQSVRRMVFTSIGDCEFTTDSMRHSIMETAPQGTIQPTDMTPLDLVYKDAERLSRHFLLASSGLVDLFNTTTYFRNLGIWVADKNRDADIKSSIFYLVLAIGAQASSADGDQTLAEKYFLRGRHMAFITFTEAPSLLTIQSYLCITMYMLGACRRNGAYMNFGIAVRAAFALGMHKSSTHALFDHTEAGARRRIWKSVRVLDIFLSASLGRPPATSDSSLEKDTSDEAAQRSDPGDRFSSKVLALCDIFERIIIDVYMKKAVSTRLADSISTQYRNWTSDLPESLQLVNLVTTEDDPEKLSKLLAASHIISSYHWSIILLTRPFLTFQIIKDMSRQGKNVDCTLDGESTSIKTFADACVDSSLKCLAIAQTLMRYASLPKRLPFIVNSVCNSALVLGAATFADQDKFLPLEDGLRQALKVLNHFAPHDPHARRYAQVINYLQAAVETYIRQRSQKSLESRSRNVTRLFGTIGQQSSSPQAAPTSVTGGPTPASSDVGIEDTSSVGMESSLYPPARPTLLTDMMSFSHPQGPAPGLMDGSFYAQTHPGLLDGATTFPDDAYYFMDQDLSMFGLWTD